MIEQTLFMAGLVVVILISVMLANRLRIAYPILLVLAGLALCFVPGMPAIQIDPELILIIFLPPLLYEDAFGVSWKELWRLRRIISSFAFPVVFVTALWSSPWWRTPSYPGFPSRWASFWAASSRRLTP